jgi:hypothetical protein
MNYWQRFREMNMKSTGAGTKENAFFPLEPRKLLKTTGSHPKPNPGKPAKHDVLTQKQGQNTRESHIVIRRFFAWNPVSRMAQCEKSPDLSSKMQERA